MLTSPIGTVLRIGSGRFESDGIVTDRDRGRGATVGRLSVCFGPRWRKCQAINTELVLRFQLQLAKMRLLFLPRYT